MFVFILNEITPLTSFFTYNTALTLHIFFIIESYLSDIPSLFITLNSILSLKEILCFFLSDRMEVITSETNLNSSIILLLYDLESGQLETTNA